MCLNDIHVAARKLFPVQGDRSYKMNWDESGLKIRVAEGSIYAEKTVDIAVATLVGGQFKFPENTVLVSAIYAISVSEPLLKALRLKIQHCVDLSRRPGLSQHLKFAIAPVNTSSLPYQFSLVEGGEFSSDSWYGSIKRKDFCLVCILGTKSASGKEDNEDEDDNLNSKYYNCEKRGFKIILSVI